MKKFYISVILFIGAIQVFGQQIQSLNCPIFIRMPCNSGTNFQFPRYFIDDVRKINSFGDDYTVKDVSLRRGSCGSYIDPTVVNPIVLSNIDDRYTLPISIGFPFTFYGQTYNKIVATTNGFISFDTTEADQFAHWSLTPGDFPNTGYDKALIAGPFHDLDPRPIVNPPADMKISYSLTGTAPNRKFIVTYYKVPMYSTSCNSLLNTHQIILHESTMVIDVFISQKRICTGWNSGKAMVGLQNMARDKGIMAPNRKATSTPWQVLPTITGTPSVTNVQGPEVWRFVPNSNSTPLYKDVTILDTFGNIIYTTDQAPTSTPLVAYTPSSDTVRVPADPSTFQIDFPTIPLPNIYGDTIIYLIKTRYNNIEVPGTYSYNIDTAYVYKDSILFRSIDTLTAGCTVNNGAISSVSFTGGTGPYTFSLDNGLTTHPLPTQPATLVDTLWGNHYYSLILFDNTGCKSLDTLLYIARDSVILRSADTIKAICPGNNGSIINADFTGGRAPYRFSLDNGITTHPLPPQPGLIVDTLWGDQSYHFIILDATGCRTNDTIIRIPLDTTNMHLNALVDTTICNGSAATLYSTLNPEATTASYHWQAYPSNSMTNATIANPNINNASASPQDTLEYTLTANWGVCVRKDTMKVHVLHRPIPFAGIDTTVCNQESIVYLVGANLDSSGSVTYEWSPAATIENPSSMITVAHPDTTIVYTLTVRDEYGCSYAITDQKLVTLRPPVPADAGNDTIGITGNTHQLRATGGSDYLWRPNKPLGLLSDSTSASPVANLNHDQMFVVKVTEYYYTPSGDRRSCIGYDSVFVTVYPGPEYNTPNAFTPNGDGLNDIFRAVPSGITSTIWFKVFNRNGEMVFQSNRWMYGWDGTRNGAMQPPGTYVWVIRGYDRNNNIVERKGTVLLLR